MATTTQAVLRQALSLLLQDYHGGTTTSAGAVGQLVDTDLKDDPDGHWNDAYVKMTSGTISGEVRRVKTSAQSTGYITPYNDFSAAPGSGATYELHKQFSPDRLDTAIQSAVRQAYPHLFQHQEINDICIGSRLQNGSFEEWTSGDADDWTKGSNVEDTEDTTAPFHGESCCVLVATGAGTYYQRQSPTSTSQEFLKLDDSPVTFYAWVWCDAADTIRLYITDPDGTTYGDYHSETGGWERLYVTRTINATGNVDFGFDVASANTMFLGPANIVGGPVLYNYTIPSTFLDQPLVVEVQRATALPEGAYRKVDPSAYEVVTLTGGNRYLRFNRQGKPPDGRWLRVRGLAYLSALSADTSTVEVGAPQTEILIAQAAVNLLRSRPFGEPSMSEATYSEALARWGYDLELAKERHRMKLPKRSMVARAW